MNRDKQHQILRALGLNPFTYTPDRVKEIAAAIAGNARVHAEVDKAVRLDYTVEVVASFDETQKEQLREAVSPKGR